MKHWRKKPARKRLPMVLICFTLCALLVALYELDRIIVPFQTKNPLWSEATIGEPVIDSWCYGGEDEEGYLIFYDNHNTHVTLPPSGKMFAADGKFVMIERASPDAIVYARPYEAIPGRWLLIVGIVIAGGIGMLTFTWKRRKRIRAFHSRKPKGFFPRKNHSQPGPDSRSRFRPSRKLGR